MRPVWRRVQISPEYTTLYSTEEIVIGVYFVRSESHDSFIFKIRTDIVQFAVTELLMAF